MTNELKEENLWFPFGAKIKIGGDASHEFDDVPAIKTKLVKGLIVTMREFGQFDITHENSGLRMMSGYETSIMAEHNAIILYRAMSSIGIEPSLLNADEIRSAIDAAEEQGLRPASGISIKNYMSAMSMSRHDTDLDAFNAVYDMMLELQAAVS